MMKTDYARSLVWVATAAAVAVGSCNLVELLLIDFVHRNPNRPRENAVEMMIFYTPLFAAIAFVDVLLVFVPSQCFQALASGALARGLRIPLHAALLLMLPATSVITWYSYDYLTPSDFNLAINEAPDWQPYRHGLSASRYLAAFAAQVLVTLFTIAHSRSRPRAVALCILLAAAAGTFWGYRLAEAQFQFL